MINLDDRRGRWLEAGLFALALFLSCVACAAAVDAVDARVAAQAWIDGGYSLQRLTSKTVVGVERVTVGDESAHVARLSGGGSVILPTDDRIDPVIAFLPSAEAALEPDSPLRTLLARDLAARMAAVTNSAPAPKRTAVALSSVAASAPTALTPAQRRWAKLLRKSTGLSLMTAAASLSSVSDVRVAPLVQSRWAQRNNSMYGNRGEPCFNYYTPGNYPCGCVATAMAQLMRYHRYPASVKAVSRTCRYGGSTGTYEMQGGTYAYDDMPLVPEAEPSVSWYVGGATEAQRMAIGKLTYDCGVAVQMDWGPGGSGAGGAAVHGPLKDVFGFASAHTTVYLAGLAQESYRDRIIRTNLAAGSPVLLSINGAVGGHTVLADGYGYSDSTAYTHLNMGWASEDDIWYALPNIGSDYTVVDGIIYNIFPQENGEIVSGRVVDGSGIPIAGADVSIRMSGASSVLKTTKTGASGLFAFVVPSAQSYVVTSTFGTDSASTSAQTGTSVDSQVWLNVGSYGYYDFSLTTAAACGNVLCDDLVLSGVPTVGEPLFSPNGGLFYPTTNVTISCATAGATIRYTLDGSEPTESSTVYTGQFAVSDDTVVKARAFKGGCNPSVIASATFTYDVAQGGQKGDFYSRPIRISGASGSYVIADNADYTLEDGEALHTLLNYRYSSQYRTCWYAWTAPGSGKVTFTTRFTTPDYLLPSAVAVYPDDVSLPTDVDSRIAMSKDYSSSGDYTTSVSVMVTQGMTYRIVGVPLYNTSGTFTLTWSGDLSVAKEETQGTEVPVPYSWLAAYYPSADASTYESLANGPGANGLTVWESYLAGLDPTNADSKLLVTIRMEGSTPVVEWNVTNAAAKALGYSYKILGSRTLGADDWTDQVDANHRFFKVVLEEPGKSF